MKKVLVIFSGGQDSTTCLLQAISEYGVNNTETITFDYGQRHIIELKKAKEIAVELGVTQTVIDTSIIQQTTHNALIDDTVPVQKGDTQHYPNTFVDGRNALFLLLAACHAKRKHISDIVIGVSQADYSGYPDCRDVFIKSMNVSLNLSLDYRFNIKTPLMYLNKEETWRLADDLGYFDYVKTKTHTCYNGVEGGCHVCPSCMLREDGLNKYIANKGTRANLNNNKN